MIATLAVSALLLQPTYTPGRYDMGTRLQLLDAAWVKASPSEKQAAVPQLTRAVGGFFGGKTSEVCRNLDEARAVLLGTTLDPLWAYTVRPTKTFYEYSEPPAIQADLAYPLPDGFTARPKLIETSIPLGGPPFISKRVSVGGSFAVQFNYARDWPAQREAMLALKNPSALDIAKEAIRLADKPEEMSHSMDLASWLTAANEIEANGVKSLDEIPFVRHKGSTFRVAFPGAPKGVMIAMHGAGGERDMFFESYGAGVWARRALEAGYVFVSPSTSPGAPAAALDWLKTQRGYVPDRVVLVGHSMGGSATLGAAQMLEPKPDAMILLAPAASTFPDVLSSVPTLLCVGENELGMLKASAERLKTGVLATPGGKFETIPHAEHLMVVADSVQIAMDWLK